LNPIPGQEERNSDHFLEEGVAIRCNNLPTSRLRIDRLLDDELRLTAMRETSGVWPARAAYEWDKLASLKGSNSTRNDPSTGKPLTIKPLRHQIAIVSGKPNLLYSRRAPAFRTIDLEADGG